MVNNSNYEIREILPDDNLILAEIIKNNLEKYNLDIPGTAYFDAELESLYESYSGKDKKGYYVVTDRQGTVVGGIGFDKYAPLNNCAELQKLYLSDCAKGFGLGYKLISFIEDKMREKGFQASYLETHHDLEAAIHIYQKSGYREIEKPHESIHDTMDKFFYKQLSF